MVICSKHTVKIIGLIINTVCFSITITIQNYLTRFNFVCLIMTFNSILLYPIDMIFDLNWSDSLGIVHPEIQMISSVTSPIVTDLWEFPLLNTKEDILKNVGNQTADGSHWLP